MAPYARVLTKSFLDDLRTHLKNRGLLRRVEKKIREIVKNPEHYKPLRGAQAGIRRVHIGHYVLLFEVCGEDVVFHAFKHHDIAYR